MSEGWHSEKRVAFQKKASAFNLGVLCLIELGAWRLGEFFYSIHEAIIVQ
jgi:hypothetical protein